MRRTLAAISCAALAATALVGCSNSKSNDAASGGVSIELWMPPLADDNKDKEMWDEILKPWEEKNGVDVNVSIVPWDSYETKYLTGITGGSGPDVGYMYSEMMGDYIDKDQLVDMSSMVTAEQKDTLYFLEQGQIDGKQFAMPFVVGGARVLVYNKDLLDKAGVQPPTTWDEFIDACKKLQAAGIKSFNAPWGDPSSGAMNAQFFPFVWQAGGELFKEDGSEALFNSPEVLEAAKFLMKLKEEGILPDATTGAVPDSVHNEFESGQLAFQMDSDQAAARWEESGINWGVIPSLKNKQEGTFVASDALTMLKKCENQELCYSLISFMMEGAQMEKFHQRTTFPPIGSDEKNNPYPQELASIYSEKADMLHRLPIVSAGATAYQSLYQNLQEMLNGQKTPEQAMKDATDAANTAISQK